MLSATDYQGLNSRLKHYFDDIFPLSVINFCISSNGWRKGVVDKQIIHTSHEHTIVNANTSGTVSMDSRYMKIPDAILDSGKMINSLTINIWEKHFDGYSFQIKKDFNI